MCIDKSHLCSFIAQAKHITVMKYERLTKDIFFHNTVNFNIQINNYLHIYNPLNKYLYSVHFYKVL